VPTLNALAAPPCLTLKTYESLTRRWTTWARELKHRTTVAGLMPRDCLPIRAQTQDGKRLRLSGSQGSSTVNTVDFGGRGQMEASAAGRPSDWSSWHAFGVPTGPLTVFLHCHFLGGRARANAKTAKLEPPSVGVVIGWFAPLPPPPPLPPPCGDMRRPSGVFAGARVVCRSGGRYTGEHLSK